MSDADPVSAPPSLILLAIGGDERAPIRLPEALPGDAVVIAADSGAAVLYAAGIRVHHLVGDLDSAPAVVIDAVVAGGACLRQLHPDKDQTDLEAALGLVADLLADVVPAAGGHTRVPVLIVGGGGGRLDHLLADVLLLAGPTLERCDLTAHLGAATVTIVRPGRSRTLSGPIGDQVSLLPAHGPVRGVSTSGLRWSLLDADLAAGTTRGLSNELLGGEAEVSVAAGVLVAVQPGAPAPPVAPRPTPYDPSPRIVPASTTDPAPGGARP